MSIADPAPVRVRVARVLHAVARGSSLDQALAQHVDSSSRDSGYARALCYTSLRHGPSNAALLAQLCARKPRPSIVALLGAALTELRFMATPAHAAVAESVAAAHLLDRDARGFVNAVLRRFLREREALETTLATDDSARLEHPRWLIDAFRRDWPTQVESLCAAGNRAGPMWLRVDARQSSRAAYQAELDELGIVTLAPSSPPFALLLRTPVAVEDLPGFAAGRVSVQDAAAQCVVEAMDVQPGQRVLDACAAPGGKTAALAERMPGIALVAVERDPARCARLRDTLARCRVDAELIVADASQPDTWWDGVRFDRILIDAPCTGTGVIRRHPDIKTLRRPEDVAALAAEQARLLDALWPLLAPGGRLTYATCSVLAAENQAQIAAFRQRTPQARPLPLDLPGFRPAGLGWQHLSGDDDMDGFYYASLQRSH